jgi:hypothetical protein
LAVRDAAGSGSALEFSANGVNPSIRPPATALEEASPPWMRTIDTDFF